MSMDLIGYVTLAEANEYISTHYLSKDALRVGWEGMSDADKTVMLTKAFQTLELLPFTGRKTDRSQLKAFPRWPHQEVPETIKHAQIENALACSDPSKEEDLKYYERLQTFGIESYSIGNLSESLGSGTSSAQITGIVSATAEKLLRPYLGGGYRL